MAKVMDKYGNIIVTPTWVSDMLDDKNVGTDASYFQSIVPGYTPPAPAAPAPVKASGGGGGSGAPSTTIRGWFQYYYGSVPSAAETASRNNWTEQDVINWSIKNNGSGVGLVMLRDSIRRTAAPYYEGDPSAIPASLVDSLITDGYWTNDGQQFLTTSYFPMLRGVGATNPLASGYVGMWVDMTGRPIGSTAIAKMNEIVGAYGYSEVGLAAWESWLKTTHSAYAGNWGAEHRAAIQTDINTILGRGATEQELSLNGNMWNLNDQARLELLRNTPEYEAIYSGKPAWMSESDYISTAMAYDLVMRWYYGDAITLGDDGSLTIPTGPYYQEPSDHRNPPPPELNPNKEVEWKSLTYETFNRELEASGVYAVGTGPTATYTDAAGNRIAWGDLINYLPQGQFYMDDQGYHYVQQAGAINPKTGQAVPAGVPTTPDPESPYSGGFGNWGISYVTPELTDYLLANNVSPSYLQQQFVWQEEAMFQQGVYGPMVAETGMGTGIDWYTLASGARGSGAMRAELMQAQNAYAFKEAFHTYTGRNPSQADYEYLTNNFVSPNEYARTMAAYESAEAKLPEINELMERVYGRTVSVEEVRDMVLGREGSGTLQALISQATRLDAFTWTFKQDQGRLPTPEEYASFAGMTGPEELVWKITTRERIAEYAPVIQQLWRDTYKRELTQGELQTLFGEQEGYGTLRAQWTAAKQMEEDRQRRQEALASAPRAVTPFSASPEGGMELTVKPIKSL